MKFALTRGRLAVVLGGLVLALLIPIGCAQTSAPATPASSAKPAASAAPAPTKAAAAQAAPTSAPASAATVEVKIGVLDPLTGGAATAGLDAKYGAQLAADIVNGTYDIPGMPMAKTEGLPGLGGAKVNLVFADTQGLPEKGQSEAQRLVTNEKVSALFGAYQSNVTLTASEAAERMGIPFVNGESSSPGLTDRGLKFFFRTTAHDGVFAKNLFDMVDELKKQKGIQVNTVATVDENTLFGTDADKLAKQYASERGYKLVADVLYPANTNEVTSEVEKLKAAKPDFIVQASYTSDAILFMKTYKQLDFNPQAILVEDSGFVDPQFRKVLGKDAEDVISRAAWSPDLAAKNPTAKAVADLFKSKFNQSMTDISARDFTGMYTLLDAINRAKSTDPKAIQAALQTTDIPASQLIVPWKGIKFDATGQNIYAQGVNMQVQGGEYYTVWPFDMAAKQLVWPRPKWSDLK